MTHRKTSCRIIVLNYNGRQILEKCLPSVVVAAERSAYAPVLTVLDNCSRDDSREYVRGQFSGVEWVDAPSNRIFCSYNQLVKDSGEDVVILLNNDIRVEPDFIDPLVDALVNDPDAFFAAPKTMNYDGTAYEGGRAKLECRMGLLWGAAVFPGHEARIGAPGRTMQTGFGAFRRSMFNELGGFDDLYLPGTVEDADLCFRAYRRGWGGVYCPDSVVYHMGQTSFKREFGSEGISRMNRRNLHLFMWKNIRDLRFLAAHAVFFLPRLLWDLLRGRWGLAAGSVDAFGRLRAAVTRRGCEKRLIRRTDAEIFALSRAL